MSSITGNLLLKASIKAACIVFGSVNYGSPSHEQQLFIPDFKKCFYHSYPITFFIVSRRLSGVNGFDNPCSRTRCLPTHSVFPAQTQLSAL
jgi:hypothetical protein